MVRFLSCIGLLFCLSGCSGSGNLWRDFDSWIFAKYGKTIFVKPEELTVRGVHLGTGEVTSSDVVIEGRITDVSEHGTYFVLFDDVGRLLVVLSEMGTDVPIGAFEQSGSIRVLGSIESGKKGLPFLRARAIRFLRDGTERARSGKEA
jgi:hypothetical protein